jgi:hypothetical protein
MGFLSSLKRVVAATATGGLSLLTSKTNQERIGTAVGVGTAVVAGGQLAGGLLGGASPAAAASQAGTTAGSLLTAGSQVAGRLGTAALGAIGLPTGITTPPSTGGAPIDSTGAMIAAGDIGAGLPTGALLVSGAGGGGDLIPAAGMGIMGRAPIGGGGGIFNRFSGTAVGAALGLKALRGVFTSGFGFVSRKKVVEIVKAIGINAAAVVLGIGVLEVAQLLAADAVAKKRRRGGITSRQLRTTRSTIGKVERIHGKLLKTFADATCGPRRPRRIKCAA